MRYFFYINRIKVEFKVKVPQARGMMVPILIESKWNLKAYCEFKTFIVISILIESKWNLKDKALEYGLIDRIDINRIKVEFKAFFEFACTTV